MRILATPRSSGISRLGGPDGPPTRATGEQGRSIPWYPGSHVPIAEFDTLALFNPVDEATILSEGGRMAVTFSNYFDPTTVKASLVAGPFLNRAFGEDTTGNAHVIYPIDGLLPLDEFTVEIWIRSKGADLTAQTSGVGRFITFAASNGDTLEIHREGTGLIVARWTIAGTPGSSANMTLSAGDVPADAWRALSLTWKSSVFKLMLGDNVRSGTSAAATTPPYQFAQAVDEGNVGVTPAGGPNALTGPFEVGEVRVSRYARTYATELQAKGPTVTIDANATQGTWPHKIGVFAQYPGWRDTAADGSAGGGGVTATSIRDQLISAETGAGLRLVRIDHIFDKIGIIDNGVGASPRYTYNWANLDGPMDLLHAAGCNFAITLDYTPSLLGATPATPPSDNNLFAQMCSDAMAHWITTKNYRIDALSFWNEPEAVFWAGTRPQFTSLWGTVQAKLATDWPAYPLGGPDTAWTIGVGSMTRDVIDYAAANGRPIGGLYHHDYTGSLNSLPYLIGDMRAYATSKGFSGSTIPIGITEWNLSLGYGGQRHSSQPSLAFLRNMFRDERLAAHAFAAVAEAVGLNVNFNTFTRMGILDTFFGSTEQDLGLTTNDDPPHMLPVYAAFQMMWKLSGTRISATTNWPGLRALASKTAAGKVTVVWGNYRPYRDRASADEDMRIGLEWLNLPSRYTWKIWTVDRHYLDGRMKLVAQGDQTNLPNAHEAGVLSVGCAEITPT